MTDATTPDPGRLGPTGADSGPVATKAAAYHQMLAAVQARASYLRCQLAPASGPTGAGWCPAIELLDGPDRLGPILARTGRARGAARPSVAAAVFLQSYAFVVAGVAVGAWALGLPSPTVEPALMAVRVGAERPDDVAVSSAHLVDHSARSLASALIDGHLGPLVANIRRTTRVGEPALWGTVAASVAAVVRSVDGPGPDPTGGAGPDPGDGPGSPVGRRGRDLLAADPRLSRMGRWEPAGAGPGDGTAWSWQRANCCLWFRTTEAAGRQCVDCSLTRRSTPSRP